MKSAHSASSLVAKYGIISIAERNESAISVLFVRIATLRLACTACDDGVRNEEISAAIRGIINEAPSQRSRASYQTL